MIEGIFLSFLVVFPCRLFTCPLAVGDHLGTSAGNIALANRTIPLGDLQRWARFACPRMAVQVAFVRTMVYLFAGVVILLIVLPPTRRPELKTPCSRPDGGHCGEPGNGDPCGLGFQFLRLRAEALASP